MPMYRERVPQWEAAQYTDPQDTTNLTDIGCTLTTINDQLCLADQGENTPIPLNSWVTKSAGGQYRVWTDGDFNAAFEVVP